MALGSASVDGLMSGLDTSGIIQSLANIQRKPIALLTDRRTSAANKLSVYQSLTGQLLALQTRAASLAGGSMFNARRTGVSDSSFLLASAAAGTANGSYAVRVEQLAQAHKVTSGAVADADTALGLAGDIMLNGKVVSVQEGDSLRDLRDAVNNAQAGVTAVLVRISADEYRLTLTGSRTGSDGAIDLTEANGTNILLGLGLLDGVATAKHATTNGMQSDIIGAANQPVAALLGLTAPPVGTVRVDGVEVAIDLAADSLADIALRISNLVPDVTGAVHTAEGGFRLSITGDGHTPVVEDDGGVFQALGVLRQGYAEVVQEAQNAVFFVDGYRIERSTNSIDDVIEGVSMDLLKADPEKTVTLTVATNHDAAVNSLSSLISEYNSIINTLNSGQQFDAETNQGGIFFGDYSILMLQDGLYQSVFQRPTVISGDTRLLSHIGISLERNGIISLNEQALRQAVSNDPQGVLALLSASTSAGHDEVQVTAVTASTAESGAAGYGIVITQAATRATATSAEMTAGIEQQETLTINGTYTVSLAAGISLEQARDRLNSVFEGNGLGMTAAVVDNRLQISTNSFGSSRQITIRSSLDSGVGGTDLGGVVAGATTTYTGRDVAGTINGQAAEGSGQWLTAVTGPAAGLQIQYSGTTTGDKGVVHVNKGLAGRLADYLSGVTATQTGLMSRATEQISDRIENIGNEIKRLEEGVQKYVERMHMKFAAMEGILAKNAATQEYLTSQLLSLQNSGVINSRR